jgi:hypothetical protein
MDRAQTDVVTEERWVEGADRHRDPFEGFDRFGKPAGEHHAARVHPDEDDVVGSLVALHDLVGDAGERPAQVRGIEDAGPKRKSATRIRGRVVLVSDPLRDLSGSR